MGAVYDSRHFIPITVSDNGVRSISVVFIGLYGKARLSLIERALLILFYYVLIHMDDSFQFAAFLCFLKIPKPTPLDKMGINHAQIMCSPHPPPKI